MPGVAMNSDMFVTQSILIAFCVNSISALSSHPLILIISFDGFRYDYLNESLTPSLYKLRSEGTYADHMKNVFPTKTFTNHHSILTGLYAEQHGVMDNSIFDKETNRTIGYSKKLFVKDGVWPITILNEVAGNGRYSGSMMWPGTDYPFNGHTITHNRLFNRSTPFHARVDEALSWFLHKEKPANLVTLYLDEPDTHGHMTGSNSDAVRQQIRRCDDIAKYLIEQLEKFNLLNKTNLFFMSDHGMGSVQVKHIINLNHYIDSKDVYFGGTSPSLGVYPAKDKTDDIYQQLKKASENFKHFNVYKKVDIPDRWKYKNNERTPPILAVADINYAFQDLWHEFEWFKEYNMTVTNESVVGVHGYDNTEPNMWPFFFASGPLVKKRTQIDPFNNVDLFELWSHILKLSPVPNSIPSSGNLKNVQGMLVASDTSKASILTFVILGVVILGSMIFIVAVYEKFGGLIWMGGASLNTTSNSRLISDRPSTHYSPLPYFSEDSEEQADDDDLPKVHFIRTSGNTNETSR